MSRHDQVGSHKTKVYTIQGKTFVNLVSTNVVSFSIHSIELDYGKFKTIMTKNRMNEASCQFDLGYKVYLKKKLWYVDYKGFTYPFVDGRVILNLQLR